ncbi:MarR family transcriptional regulator [Mycolicibacterium sp. P9-64]|uniref:MarR family winged helix-turn-helix transcriptional regulator n=1 Tax=Mycolicibacterium sp. P9-64 TaxID=2024612 RepID=UPI0011EC0BC6|nr:MarR family transcriptional regulator [Mycolicibacterium sp. P9-64]KAA0082569.1 MarR family transcriptional regulator [Mycolicibacterium sp. P9-64]
MSDNPLADEVWRTMATVVFDHRDSWKRDVIDATGLPFSRVRVITRLAKRAMTAKEIAESATMDAPATTVALNDLEGRGLIVREADPTNRRCKLVSLTDKGRAVVASIDEVDDPAPDPFLVLSQAELRTLETILAKMAHD